MQSRDVVGLVRHAGMIAHPGLTSNGSFMAQAGFEPASVVAHRRRMVTISTKTKQHVRLGQHWRLGVALFSSWPDSPVIICAKKKITPFRLYN